MYNITYYTLMTLFILISLFMILLVLIQKGRGGGLSSAFTGGGGNTAFGSKTGDVLTWVTSVTFGIFILLAIAMNLMVVHWPTKTKGDSDKITQQTTNTQPPANSQQTNTPPIEPIETPPASQPSTTDLAPASAPAIPATMPANLPTPGVNP